MANKSIQIRNIDNLVSKVSLELSMEILKDNEKEVRDLFSKLSDEIQDRFERVDELDLSRPPREASEMTPIATVITKKAKAKKPKLPKTNEVKAVEAPQAV